MVKFCRSRAVVCRSVPAALLGVFLGLLTFSHVPPALGGTFYWDNDANPGNNNRQTGAGLGAAGTWDTTSAKWWDGVSSDATWNNANNDTAVFWGTAGTVTLQAGGITVGGLAFNTTAYTLSGSTLTFGAATNNITFNNVAAATISSIIAGSGDMLVTGGIYGGMSTASTLTLSGTGAAFTGNVTIGNNMTVLLSGTAGTAFSNAASVTLNGGGLSMTNTTAGVNRVNNGAAINSNGGTITFTNTSGANVYTEVVGALNLLSGQINIVEATNQASTGSQTLTFTGFSRTGATNSSTVTFSATTTGPQASGNKNMISITGTGTTTAGQIVGPWATTGTAAANQTDYAVFSSDFVVPANITASAENLWTTAANAYTLSGATTLTGTRTITALRYTGAAATLALGSNNLNTFGILNGGTGTLTISGSGVVSTPSGGGFLYLNTGNNAITISSAINDNSGAVAVVKDGSAGILTLSSTASNFSGGLIIENGVKPTVGTATTFAVSVGADTNLGATAGGITFNGSATLGFSAGFTVNASRTITINNGAIAKFEEGAFSSTLAGKITGTGGIILDSTSGDRSWTLSNTGNDFQGPMLIGFTSNVVTAVVASLADSATANGAIRLQATTGSGVFQWSTSATTALTLNNRQLELTGSGGTGALDSSNATATNIITVNTDLLDSATAAKIFALQGSNTGNNTFAGKISDGATSVVSLLKTGAGTWIVSGNSNTYTGTTTVNQGTLIITGNGAPGAISVTGTGTLKFSGGGMANSPITIGVNSTLTLDNSAGILADRLNTSNVTMTGGTLNEISGTGATTDHIGTLAINLGGPNLISLTGNASGATSITASSLTRATGALLQVTGSNLGAAPGANATNLIISANGTGAGVIGDTGAAGSTNISINPFILGQDTALSGNAQFGFMTDQINGSLLANGLRNLTAAEYATNITDGSSALNNVSLNHGISGLDTTTTINALRLDAGGNVNGLGTLTINSGAVFSLNGVAYKGIAVGTLNFGGAEAVFNAVNSDLNVTSVITGSGGLSKGGAGVLTLNGANNLTGAVSITDGVLRMGTGTAISSDGASVVTLSNNSGVYLDLAGNNTSLGALSGAGTTGGQVSLRGATLALGGGNSSGSYAGTILGAGAVVKTGNGTQTLAGANTYAGSTTINGGVLQGGVASFLPQATALNIGASGTLDLGGFAVTVGQFSGSGVVTNTSATAVAFTLGNVAGNFDTIFSGSFNSTTPASLTLSKTGGGTLTLNGTAGTATGAWTLNAGTIKLDFSTSATANNIINAAIAPTFSGGSLTVSGAVSGPVSQTLGNVTVNARGGTINMIDNGGGSTALIMGTLTATAAGGSLLVNAPSGTTVTFNTDGSTAILGAGRVVFTDGSGSYNWAVNSGVNTTTAGLAFASYTPFAGSGTSASSNYLQTDTLAGGLTASESVNTLKITDTAPGGVLALGANTLTITTGGLLYDGANGYTISASTGSLKSNIATTSDLIIQAYGGGVLTIAAAIVDGNGASTLTKAGTGKVVLTGTNTYTGGTFINGGILSISSNVQLGNTATSAITISDGATLQTTATFSTSTHTYALGAGNATLDIAPSTTLTINGVISGSGGLTLNNTGTLSLTAAATYTGPTFVNAGVLQGGVATFINASTGGTLTINSPGSVNLNAFALTVGGLAGSGNITNSGATATVTVGGNNISTTYSGVIAGANLAKSGSGTLTLTNTNTYTGTTSISNGTIRWGADNVLAAGTAVTIGNAAGPVVAVLDLNGHAQTFNATTAITLYGTTSTSSSQAIINIGAGGNLTLANALTETVNATPANGFLGALITGGTLTMTAARTFTIADSINAAADLTITSSITGAGGITKAGAGNLVLAGVNNNTGTSTIQVGTITAGVNGAMSGTWTITATGAGVTGTLDLNGTTQSLSTLLTLGGSTATSTPVVNLNGGQLTIGGGITYTSTNNPLGGQINSGTLDLGGANRTITVNNSTSAATDLSISSVIQGSAGVVVAGTGTLQLSGANIYTGNTTMSAAGVLQMGAANAMPFGSGKGNLIINAGTFDLNGFATTLNAVTASASGGLIDNTSASAATLAIGANNTDGTSYAGAIQNTGGGALSLTKTGSGAQVLGGNVALNGTLGSSGGALTVSGAISGVTGLNVTGGTLNFDGAFSTPASVSSVTVNGGGGLYFRGGTGAALSNITSLNLGSGSGTANVGLEAGTSTSTLTASTAAFTSNNITLNVKPIAGFTVGNTYNLLAAPSGLNGGTYKILVGGYTYTTNISDTLISVTPTAAVTGNFYWKGGVDNSWSGLSGGNTNWTTDLAGTLNAQTIPGAANTVVFSANALTGTTLTTTLDTNMLVNNIVFNNNTGSGPLSTVNINSGAGVNRLVIAPASATDGINLQTGAPATVNINSLVNLGATQTWTVADSGSVLNVNNVISGAAGVNLNIAGSGTVVLGAANNSFGGSGSTVNVQSGRLQFNNDSQLGNTLNTLTIGTNSTEGTLAYTGGTATISRTIALGSNNGDSAGNTISNAGGGVLTLSGVISGGPANGSTNTGTASTNAALRLAGGSFVLSATNTFTGDIIVGSGATLSAGALGNFGAAGGPTGNAANTPKQVFVQSGGTLTATASLNPQAAATGPNSIFFVFGENSSSVSTLNANSGTFQLDDAGQFTLNGQLNMNIASGAIVLLGSSAPVGFDVATTTFGNSTLTTGVMAGSSVTVSGQGTLRLANAAALGGVNKAAITMNTGSILDLIFSGGANFGNALTVAGDVTVKTSRGTAASTNIAQVMGALSIGSSTLTFIPGTSNTAPGVANVTFVGTTTLTGNPTFAMNYVNGTGIGTMNIGALDDGGTARTITVTTTNASPSALALTGTAVSYSGTINVTNGTYLVLGAAGANGTGTVNITNGSVVYEATNANSGGTVNVGDTSGSSATTLAIGASGVTVNNPFVLRNGSSGATTITTIVAGSSLAAPNTGGFGMAVGGIGYISTGIDLAAKTSGALNIGAAANTSLVISGPITESTGPQTLNIFGPGNVYLLGDKAFTGGIIDNGAYLGFGPSTTNFTGNLTVNGGGIELLGTYVLPASTITIGANASGTSLIYLPGSTATDYSSSLTLTAGGTLIVDTVSSSTTVTYATAFGSSVAAGFSKSGQGTLTLAPSTGGNTWTGATTLGAGTLALNFVSGGTASNVISASSALQTQGGTLTVNGGSNTNPVTQTFAGTTIQAGISTITLTKGSASTVTLNTGAITRTGNGVLVFSTIPASTSINAAGTSNNAAGIIGGYAIIKTSATLSDWAIVNGSNLIAPYASYTTLTTAGGGTQGTTNFTMGASVTLTAAGGASITANSLRMSATSTLALGANNSLKISSTTGGIMYALTSGTGTISGTPAVGTGLGYISATGTELALYINNGGTMTISAGIGGTTTGFGLTVSGAGTLNLTNTSTTNTNNFTGALVINGGVTVVGTILQEFGAGTSIVLNGGTLNSNNGTSGTGFTLSAQAISLGLNGGTLLYNGTGINGGWTNATPIALIGSGSRTLTLGGTDTGRIATLSGGLGDGGGPSSLIINGGSDTSAFQLSAANAYTGSTTVNRGILILNNASALPGESNLVFNDTTAPNDFADLEMTATSGTTFTRSLGTGPGQVQWLGNGGFSGGTGTNTATGVVVVNLGGAGATVTWGSGGFVPDGNTLSFAQGMTNSPSIGAIDFQNGINFGSLTTRTIDVENGAYAFNLAGASSNNTGYDAKLTGSLASTSTGGFTKTGPGALWLTGDDSGFLGTITVANGYMLFQDVAALPANLNSITVSTTTSPIPGVGGIVLQGQTNFNTLFPYINPVSNGMLALDTSSTESINFQAAGLSSARFGAFGTVVYTGKFTPGVSGAYKLGGTQGNNISGGTGLSVLALPRTDAISGSSSTLDVGTGILLLGSSNNYGDATHGTTLQFADVLQTGAGGTAVEVLIAKDGALGSGTISLINAQATTTTTGLVLGAAYGDHTISNDIVINNTGGISNLPFVLSGDTTSDLVPSAGRMTYTGTISLSGTSNIALIPRTTGFILNGKVTGSPVIHFNGSATLVEFNNLTGSPNDFTSSTIFLSGGVTFLIGHASDLGDSVTARGINWNTTNSVFGILPGVGDITTTANITLVDNISTVNKVIDVPTTQTLKVSGGLVSANRTLQAYTKTGTGTFDIGAQLNPGTSTAPTWATTGITISQGTLKADFTNAAAATNIIGLANGVAAPLTFSGGTMLLVGKSATVNSQAFGALTVSARANALTLTSAGATLTTSFTSMGTRGSGGTLALTLPTDGPASVAVTTGLVAQNSLLVDSASTKAPFMVVGTQGGNITDWAAVSGTTIVALSTYTGTTVSTVSGNATVATGVDTTLAANAAADSLRFNLGETRTINLNGNTLNVGGILNTAGVGANVSTISNGSLTTASGAAANADLVIFQANTASTLSISANIVNNGANAAALTKSGAGEVVLSGNNTYSGATFLNEGITTITKIAALGDGTGALNFGGGTLHYTGAGDAGNAGTLTNTTVSVARFTTINVDNGANLTLNGTITGTLLSPTYEIMTKTGQGTLTLGGNTVNTNLPIDVQGGVLLLNKSGGSSNAIGIFALNVLSNVGLTVESGAVAQLGGDTPSGDQILNTSSVQLNGTGTFDLAGHNETIDGLGGSASSIVTNTSGAASVLTVGSGSMVLGAPTQFNGVLQDGSGTLGLSMIGGNIFTLTNTNTYTGKTTITGQQYGTTGLFFGGISISSANNLGGNPANFTADQWTFNGGRLVMTGDVTLNASRNNVGIMLAANGGIFEVTSSNTFTVGVPNIISGSGGLTKEGAGTMILQGGANTYTGKTILNQGVLSISAQGALGNNPGAFTADQLTFNGGQLATTANLSLSDANRGVTIQGYGGTLAPSAGTTLTLPNTIAGTGDLTLTGSGTVVLGGTNTWTGKTILTGGELRISAAANLGATPPINVLDQLQISNNANFHVTASVALSGNRGVTIGNNGGTITTDASTVLAMPGVLSLTNGTLTKAGAGVLVLSANNIATSGTSIAVTNGVLRLGSAGALPAATNLNINGGGVVELGASDFLLSLGTGDNQVQFTGSGGFGAVGAVRNVNLGGAGDTLIWNTNSFVPTGSALILSSATSDNTVVLQNGIDLNGAVRSVQVNDGAAAVDATLAGALSDSLSGGGLIKTGAGTLSISAAATYGGTTQVSAGTLQADATNVFASNSAFTLDNTAGVVLDLNNNDQFIGSLAGGGANGGNVNLGSATLTVGGNNQSTSYAGQISGGGGLTKIGSGNFSLSAPQSYTGQTNIANGKLFVNSTLASTSITVGSSGTLGGSGSLSGLVTVNSGGTIQAGDLAGLGSLALPGGLTFSSFGTINVGQIAEAQPNILNIGTLTSGNFIGAITINVITNSPSGYQNGVPYTLLTYTGGAIQGGVGFSAFQLGTVAGTNSRTTGFLNDTGSAITLTLNADNPKWTGFDANLGQSSSRWAALPFVFDWKLISAGSPTAYLEGDVVLFDDSVIGSRTVSINDGDVHPSSVTFNNSSSVPYILGVLGDANGVAGSTPFIKSNTGTVTIIDANSFTGGVNLNGGIIQLGNDFALGTQNGLSFGPNVAAGTKLQLNGHSITLTGLDTDPINPGSAVVEDGAAGVDSILTLNLQTVGGPISGNPNSIYAGVLQDGSTGRLLLTLAGDGKLTLTGANTYTGLTTITGATLQIGNGGTTGSIAGTGGITNNGALIFNRSDSYNYSGNITGSGTTQVTGGGTLTLSGSLGSTGGVTIDPSNTLRVGNGGAGGSIAGNISIGAGGALIFNTTNSALIVDGDITGGGSLQQNNASGTTILTGTNNYSGGTTITFGTLQIGNSGTSGSITGNVNDNGTLAFSHSDDVTFTGDITGSGGVLVNMASSTATLTLSGNDSYSNGVVIRQGVLQLGSATAVPSGSSVTIGGSGTSGTLDLNGQNLTVSSLGTTGTASAQTITNNSATANSTLTYSGAGTSTFGGLIKNGPARSVALSITNGGKLILSNTNSYTGGTSITNGTATLGAANGIGNGSLTLGGAGTNGVLDLGGFNQTVTSIAVGPGATANNQLVGNSSTASNSVLTINGSSTFDGIIQDVLGIGTKTTGLTIASGTTVLTNASTYTGATTINAGATLQLGNGGTSGSLSNSTTISDNGTLTYNRSDNVVVGSSISGSGGLQQIGSGTVELTASNSYGGTTVMNNVDGTLKLSGANSSATGNTTLTTGTLLLNNSGANNGGLAGGTITISGGTIDNVTGAALALTANNTVTIGGGFIFTGSNDLNFGSGAVNNSVASAAIVIGGTGRTLALGAMTNTTGTTTNTITVNGTGNTLVLGSYALSNNATSRVNNIAGTANVTITGPVINGGTSTAGGINFTGSGFLTLQGANNYGGLTTMNNAAGTILFSGSNSGTGGITLTAGTLQLNGSPNGGMASGTITITAGTITALNAPRSLVNNVLFGQTTTASTITFNGSQNLAINGTFTVVSGVARTMTSSITGGGTLTLSGNVFLSDSATASSTWTIGGTGATTINGNIANFNGSGIAGNITVTNSNTSTLGGTNTYTGTTTMNAAAGTLVFSGSNNSSGGTTLTTGTLQFNNASNGGIASGTLTLTAGTIQAINAARSLSNAVTLTAVTVSGTQSLNFNGTVTGTGAADRTLTNNITQPAKLNFNNIAISDNASTRILTIAGTGDNAITGAITNGSATTGSLTLNTTGTTTISAAAGTNTYNGSTNVQNGTLVLTADNTLPTGTTLTIGRLATGGAAATVDMTGINQTVGALTVQSDSATADHLTITTGKTLTVNGNVTLGSSNATTTTTNLIASGGGTLTVNNATANGIFTVGGYTGATGGQGNIATADLSGLSTVNISLNTSSGTVRVNNTGTGNTNGVFSTLLLPTTGSAATNITAANLNVGDGGEANGQAGQVNTMKLGSGVTTINVNTINIGTGSRDTGAIVFTNASGSLVVRDTTGTGRVALNIGTGTATTGVTADTNPNNFDVTGHNADLLLGAVVMGTQGRGASLTSALSFDQGTMDMTSLTMSTRTADTTNGAGLARNTTSTVNIGGGTVNIQNGILSMGSASGAYGTNPAPIMNATVNISGGNVTIGATSGTAITMASYTASGGTGTGAANGTLNLTGGVTTVNGNIVKVTASAVNATATVNLNGGTLDMAGHNIGAAGNVVNGIFASGTLKNLGELNGGGALTKTTSGTLVMSGVSTYSGPTNINGGVLQFSSLSNNLGTGTAINFDGGTLQYNGNTDDITVRTVTLNAGGGSIDTNGSNVAYANPIGGTGGLTKFGAGTLTYSGTTANTYSGVTTVTAGTLALNKTAGINAIVGDGASSKATPDVLVNGGTLIWNASNQLDDSVYVSITSGTANLNGKTETMYHLSNAGGTFLLGGRGASLTVTDPDWSGGTNDLGAGSVSNFGVLNISGGVNTIHGNEQYSGPGEGGAVLTIGASGLNFSGTSNPNLTVNSDFVDGVNVNQGQLVLNGDVSFTNAGASSTASITNGQARDIDGVTLLGFGNLAATVDLGGVNRIFNVTNGTGTNTLLVDAQVINGSVTKTGNGVLKLFNDASHNVANTYAGGTNINGGTLAINSDTSLGSTAGTTTINAGTLEVTQDLTSSRNLVLGDVTSAISVDAGKTYRDNGVISSTGSGSLTKTGGGLLVLANSNTYTGTTTVSGGTLQVGVGGTGSTGSGALTVVSSGTVAGSGTISGTANLTNHSVQSGGFVAPGDTGGTSLGTLTFNGNLELMGGSTTTFQIDSAGSHDFININGSLTLNSGSSISLVDFGNFAATVQGGQSFDLLDWTSLINNGFTVGTNFRSGGTGGGDLNLVDLSSRGLGYDVSDFLAHGVITITPEPGRVMLLAWGAAALMLRRRRKVAKV